MVEYSITALEKSIRTFADKLEQDGYETEIEVFKSGRGRHRVAHSYVKLRVDGDDLRSGVSKKFLSGGYTATSVTEISTADGIREAKDEFIDEIVRRKLQRVNES